MAEKIKVLLISNTLSCGGAERQLTIIANALAQTGDYEVDVLYYAQRDGEFADRVRAPIFIDKEELGGLRTILAIRRVIRHKKYDIVNVFGGTANIYGRAAARLSGTPVIVGALRGMNSFGTFPIRFANNVINLFCNDWLVNNPLLVSVLKKQLCFVREKRVHMIYNGFVPASEIDYRENEVTEFDTDKRDNFIFGSVGRLDPVKNQSLFLEAAKRIADRHERVRFWLIGDGELQEGLMRKAESLGISDKVRFWGYRRDTDVAISRMDVYLQTSQTEGTPNAVIEAMRASKPVISTASTDMTDIIHDGLTGYITPVSDLAALVEKMETLYQSTREERGIMGNRGAALFAENFLVDKSVAAYDSYYRSLYARRKKA